MPNDTPQSKDERSLLDRILNKADDLATLEILTTVGSVEKDPTTGRYNPVVGSDTPAILTKIELIEGDIVTVFHRDSLTGDLQELREIHKEREAQGMQIINDRIAAVKELIKLVADLRGARQAKDQST